MKVIVKSFSKRPRLVLVRDAFRKTAEVSQYVKPNTKMTLDVEPGKEIWLAGGNLFSFDDDKDRKITISDGELGVAGPTPVFQVEEIPRSHHHSRLPKGMYGTHRTLGPTSGYSGRYQ